MPVRTQENQVNDDEVHAGWSKNLMSKPILKADVKPNSQCEFFIGKGEDSLGPWTIDEVVQRISRSELSVTDFVFDEKLSDWIPLMECEALKEHLAKAKPKAPPARFKKQELSFSSAVQLDPLLAEQQQRSEVSPAGTLEQSSSGVLTPQIAGEEWFIQKGVNRFGPISYFGVVRALQEKTIYDFDFVWKSGMASWIRIAEHELFQPESIRNLSANLSTERGEIFFQRQYARVQFESEVIVHDDQSVWLGRAFEASVGGSGLLIENAVLSPGQVIRLHFAPCNGLPAFNAMSEIVGKKYQRQIRAAKTPVKYAVRFLRIDESVKSRVQEYFSCQRRENAS